MLSLPILMPPSSQKGLRSWMASAFRSSSPFEAFGEAQHTGGGLIVPDVSAHPLRQAFVDVEAEAPSSASVFRSWARGL